MIVSEGEVRENALKVTLWNGDVLTIPYVNGKYTLKSVFTHMKLLLKDIPDGNEQGFLEVEESKDIPDGNEQGFLEVDK